MTAPLVGGDLPAEDHHWRLRICLPRIQRGSSGLAPVCMANNIICPVHERGSIILLDIFCADV